MPDLAVVIPAYNERDNVVPMVERLDAALAGIDWVCMFVDDNSPDGTARAVRAVAETDRRVGCVVRVGRRGLASAVIEGVMATDAPVIAVIDADLQHDETVLPQMFEAVRGGSDVAVASRYAGGGSTGEWDATREKASRLATRIGAIIGPDGLSDPMSGCFAAKREAFEGAVQNMSGKGYKILLDLFAASPRPLSFVEVAYTFRNREAGESKMSLRVLWDYLLMLLDHTVGHAVPTAVLVMLAAGAASVIGHMAVVSTLINVAGTGFAAAHGVALAGVLAVSFALAEAMAHRPRKGSAWVGGFAGFAAAAAPGWMINGWLGVALADAGVAWALAALAGAAVGAGWSQAALAALKR